MLRCNFVQVFNNGWTSSPVKKKIVVVQSPYSYQDSQLKRYDYAEPKGDDFRFWRLEMVHEYDGNSKRSIHRGYRLSPLGVFETKTLKRIPERGSEWLYRNFNHRPILTEQQVLDRMAEFVDVFMVLESGKKVPLRNLYHCGEIED